LDGNAPSLEDLFVTLAVLVIQARTPAFSDDENRFRSEDVNRRQRTRAESAEGNS
jgi:hypothetical protein